MKSSVAAWSAGGLPAWFEALRGTTSRRDVAGRAGFTVPQVGRWLRGEADPRLPELLALIDALTGRVGGRVGGHRRGARVGRVGADVGRLVDALEEAGVVSLHPVRVHGLTVDVPPGDDAIARVRQHWTRVSAARLDAPGTADRFSFNVCGVSRVDLDRLLALQSAWFREVRSLVAASEPTEVAALVVMHTVVWDAEPENV